MYFANFQLQHSLRPYWVHLTKMDNLTTKLQNLVINVHTSQLLILRHIYISENAQIMYFIVTGLRIMSCLCHVSVVNFLCQIGGCF
jgi:hypothetical protein